MTELACKVIKSLECKVSEIVYITDSSIALAWIRSTTKRLKNFVANRVCTALTMIKWAMTNCNLENSVPLFHISGGLNLADKLTKLAPFDTKSVGKGSEWNEGLDWMKLPTSEMPLISFERVQVEDSELDDYDKACVAVPHLLNQKSENELPNHVIQSVCAPPEIELVSAVQQSKSSSNPFLVDLIFYGWKKSLRILARCRFFISKLRHRLNKCSLDCEFCQNSHVPITLSERKAESFLFEVESKIILKEFPAADLRRFIHSESLLLHEGRINDEHCVEIKDVDFSLGFDINDFSTNSHVVRVNSPVFLSYLAHVHLHLVPHSGNLKTERILLNKMYPLGRFRNVIDKVRKDCPTCRLLSDKTVQLRMAKFPKEKLFITPPFYNIMLDIVFGFNGKPFTRARTSVKLYALVIVCLTTSAVSIWCMEALSTQEVINALLCHSSRYGLPCNVFCDNGSQLATLQNAKFTLRDIDTELWDLKGIRVMLTRPKAHQDAGKVEVRVKLLREMLKKAKLANVPSMTQLQLETTFNMIANDLNNIPMCRTDGSNVKNKLFEVITPNRLLIGRNNFRSLYLDVKLDDTTLPSQILTNNAKMFSVYWQTLIDHLHYFNGRQPGKWTNQDERQPKIGDLISFLFDDNPVSPRWKLGRIVDIKYDRIWIDYVNITTNSDHRSKVCVRGPRQCKIIVSECEQAFLSNEYRREGIGGECDSFVLDSCRYSSTPI